MKDKYISVENGILVYKNNGKPFNQDEADEFMDKIIEVVENLDYSCTFSVRLENETTELKYRSPANDMWVKEDNE